MDITLLKTSYKCVDGDQRAIIELGPNDEIDILRIRVKDEKFLEQACSEILNQKHSSNG